MTTSTSSKRKTTAPATRNLRVVPARTRSLSVNVEARTFDVVLSTETPVRRYGELRGLGYVEFDEVLPSAALETSRLSGAPLADTHDLSTIENVLGVIIGTRRETIEDLGEVWIATVKVSRRKMWILEDVEDGILAQVSVGYTVIGDDYDVEQRDGQVPIARAKSWTPHEVSLVPVGADPNATVRSAYAIHSPSPSKRTAPTKPTTVKKRFAMKFWKRSKRDASTDNPELENLVTAAEDAVATADQAVAAADEAIAAVVEALDALPADASGDMVERARKLRGVRADDEEPATTEAPAEPTDDEKESVRKLARDYGESKLVNDLFSVGATATQARTALRAAMIKRSTSVTDTSAITPKIPARGQDNTINLRSIYAEMNKR